MADFRLETDLVETKQYIVVQIGNEKYGIDIRKEPILVYPTLHYQNGGLDIDADCMTTNIDNAAFLHGVFAYYYPDEYVYSRDSLSKRDAEETHRE